MLETVSAVMDDEASEFELRRLLDEAARNPEIRDAWRRYHLIGVALRGEWRTGGDELRAGVRKAVRAGPPAGEDVEGRATDRNSWWGRLAAVVAGWKRKGRRSDILCIMKSRRPIWRD